MMPSNTHTHISRHPPRDLLIQRGLVERLSEEQFVEQNRFFHLKTSHRQTNNIYSINLLYKSFQDLRCFVLFFLLFFLAHFFCSSEEQLDYCTHSKVARCIFLVPLAHTLLEKRLGRNIIYIYMYRSTHED